LLYLLRVMYSNTDAMDNMDFLMNEDLMSPQRTTNKSSNWMSPFGQLASVMPSPPGTNMSLGIGADFSPDESMKKMTANISAAVSDMSKNRHETNFSPSLFSPPQRKGKRKNGYQSVMNQSKINKFPDVGSDFDNMNSSANDTTTMADLDSASSDMNTTVGMYGNSSSSSSDGLNSTKVYSPTVQNIRASLIKSVFNNNDASVSVNDRGNFNNDTVLLNASSTSSPSVAMDTSVSENRVKCNCKKSKCLKLYCQCFAVMSYCDVSVCNCVECNNLIQFESIRAEAIKDTKERNRSAFVVKVSDKKSHANGCTCKKSQCLKKYCECFEAYAHCGDNCKCVSCENYLGSVKLESMNISREKKAGQQGLSYAQQNSYIGMLESSTSYGSTHGSPGIFQSLPSIRQLQAMDSSKDGPKYPGLPSLGTKPASMDPNMTISALADSFSRSNKRRIMYVEGEDILTRHIPTLRTVGSTSSSTNTSMNTSINATTLAIAKGENVATISPIDKNTPPVYGSGGRVVVAVVADSGGNKRLAISPCEEHEVGSSSSGTTSACTSLDSASALSPPLQALTVPMDTPSRKARYFFEYTPQPIIVYPFFGPNCSIKMPKLLALYIIDFLDDKDLCNLSLVNKLWCSTSFDDALWE
jgi:hypothetical protein